MAKDPVCEMDVNEEEAKSAGNVSTYNDKEYFFCADACKEKFDSNPEKFVK